MRKDAPSIALFHAVIHREHRPDLRDVSIEIEPGSWVEIVGPSRSGKSDLFAQLSLRGETQGSLLVHGVNAARMSDDDFAQARRRVTSSAQIPLFISELSMAQNLVLPVALRGDDAREECERLVDEFELDHIMRRHPNELVWDDLLACSAVRALLGSPELIFLDAMFDQLSEVRRDLLAQQLRVRQIAGASIVLFGRRATEQERAQRWTLNEQFEVVENVRSAA